MANQIQTEKNAHREAAKAKWWNEWFADDYSWDGLAKKPWHGWIVLEDKATYDIYIKKYGLPKGCPNEYCQVIPADKYKDLPEGTKTRGATLQDYWRDQENMLESQNGSNNRYTVAHLPPNYEDGSATWKKDENHENWRFLQGLVQDRVNSGELTVVEINAWRGETVSGIDARSQFEGCALLALPSQKSLSSVEVIKGDDKQNGLHLTLYRAAVLNALDFGNTLFASPTNFGHAAFSAYANFSGAKFAHVAFFEKAIFSARSNFTQATFSADANFCNAIFSVSTSFGRATFAGEANFAHVTFSADANYESATFSANAYFDGAAFSTKANFQKAIFSDGAYFGSSKYSADAYFKEATFFAETYFGFATFCAEAYFGATTFSSRVNFRFSTFSGDANFGHAIFSARTSFRRVTFLADANFANATFSADANYESSTFSSDANFDRAIFFANANFRGTKVNKSLTFVQTRFEGSCNFQEFIFGTYTKFLDTIFPPASGTESAFRGAQFNGPADFSRPNVKGEDGNPFHEKDLHFPFNAFDHANIKDQLILTRRGDRYHQAEFDRALKSVAAACREDEGNTTEDSYVALEQGCTTLKKAMENISDKTRAQRFFKFELLARQRRPSTGKLTKFMTRAYGITSDYGGSMSRPLWAMFATWIFFTLIFGVDAFMIGVEPNRLASFFWGPMDLSAANVFRPFLIWSKAILPNDNTWMDLYQDILTPGGWLTIKLLATAQSFLSITFLFLFGLATKRKFQIS